MNLLFARLRSLLLLELIWSKYDHFYCIFWTADPFATKLGLIVHYHKPECPVEKWDYCIQGHSKSSNCLWLFVWMIFSEPQNILLTNTLFNIFLERIMTDTSEDHEGTVCIMEAEIVLFCWSHWWLSRRGIRTGKISLHSLRHGGQCWEDPAGNKQHQWHQNRD